MENDFVGFTFSKLDYAEELVFSVVAVTLVMQIKIMCKFT